MQVQTFRDAQRDLAPGLGFVIAENAIAKLMHMKPQLMHTSGRGLQRHPSGPPGGG